MSSMTPDFLNRLFFWRKSKPDKVDDENLSKGLSKWEDCVNKLQKILIWEDPIISSLSLAVVNVLFWLLVHLECKFYGLIFSTLLVISLHQLWTEYIWPELKVFDRTPGSRPREWKSANVSPGSIADISRYISKARRATRNACLKVYYLRKDQPGTFCVVTCICFLCLSIIGRSISGVMLLYTMLMIVMMVPGACIHLLPNNFISSVLNTFNSSHKDTDKEVEEYLPETSGEALQLLNLAGELQLSPDDDESNDLLLEQMSTRTNDTAGSSCSKLSFCPDTPYMPSHEHSLDFLEFDLTSAQQDIRKSEGEDSEQDDIQFQSKHFNGDSSDEDEEFSKGLKFKEVDKHKRPVVETKPELSNVPTLTAAANVGRNLWSIGSNILSAAVTSPEPKQIERESSSDTDSFELISEEDM